MTIVGDDYSVYAVQSVRSMTTVTVSSLGIERVQKFDNTERGCVGRSSRSIFAMTLAGPLRDECGTRRNLLGFAALRRTSDAMKERASAPVFRA